VVTIWRCTAASMSKGLNVWMFIIQMKLGLQVVK
jgi:hypothetical protein